MADPISLVASLITLLSTGIKLSRTIYQTVDSIKNSPKHIKAISADLKGLYHVLGMLYGVMSSDDTRGGVLHPAVSDSLEMTLSNTIEAFKELNILVNSFIQAENEGDVHKWAGMRYTWKAEEVERWSRQLADQKLTLNIAVATANLINTGNISTTTARAAEDIRELKRSLTELLLGMERMENRYTEQNVVVRNYRSTIRRLAPDMASFSSVPSIKTPDSPDMAISAIVSTGASTTFYSISTSASVRRALMSDEHSAFITAPSLRSSSTYFSALASDPIDTNSVAVNGDGPSQPSRDSQSHGALISQSALANQDQADRMNSLASHEQCHIGILQIFIKGLSPGTQSIQLEGQTSYDNLLYLIRDRVGVPPDRISLYYNGRRLTGLINLPNNATLQGSLNAYTVERNVDLEFDGPLTLRRGKLRKRSLLGWHPTTRELRYQYAQLSFKEASSSSLSTRSMGSYYGEEVSAQQRYAEYLKWLFQTKFRKRSMAGSILSETSN